MSDKGKSSTKAFRLAYIRRKIHSTFSSEALKAALLAELEERGKDATLVVQMVERIKPATNPPVQAVVPVLNANAPQPGPAPAPRQAPAPAPAADGHTAERAYEVLDSEDELIQDLSLTPRRERRLRDRLQTWRSSSSE